MKASPMVWTGRVLTGLFALFMLGASITPKLLGMDASKDIMVHLGWPTGLVMTLGLIELGCLILYLIPQTAVLGAVLMTAYLGGAIATDLRVGEPLFSHTLFGMYLGLFLWGGLWLRDARLRAVFPILRG